MAKPDSGRITLHFMEPTGRRREVTVAAGTTVMEAAVSHGVAGIEAICGGNCSCGTCHVYVDAPWNRIVGPAEGAELELLSAVDYMQPESRLGCQIKTTRKMNGMTLRIPAST